MENAKPFTHIVIHHTGAEEKNTEQIRRYHLSRGWQDIGYHYVIERDGKIVSGRRLSAFGAHCLAGGMNQKAIGIALIGNFEETYPSFQQVQSLEKLLRELSLRFNMGPANILLHQQVVGAKTLCPGKKFSRLFTKNIGKISLNIEHMFGKIGLKDGAKQL